MLLSVVTFSANDPSLNHVVSRQAEVSNQAGLFGAYTAGFLNDVFGIGAYIWPLVFGALGASCVSPAYTISWWRWCGLFLLTICLLVVGAAWDLSLDDAILDGLLPAPDYITAAYSFEEDITKAEKRLEDNGYSDEKKAKVLIEKARRTLENAGGLRQVFEDRLRNRNGKYIVFCRDWGHMKAMMELVNDWFGFCPERHVYRLYSDFRNHKDLDGFAADDSDALKLLFSIDMLNEGVHIAGIDGVIMLRPTQSPNVYFQQLGRALSVTAAKVPQVFDIVDNFAGMNIAQKFWTGLSQKAKSEGRPFAGRFEVAASQIGLLDIIRKLEEMRMSWDDWYNLACRYAQEKGSLSTCILKERFDGRALGEWIGRQKVRQSRKLLSDIQMTKLDSLGIRWQASYDQRWDSEFQKLVASGCKSNQWLKNQRKRFKLGKMTEEQKQRLEEAGFTVDVQTVKTDKWYGKYEKAKAYYEENGAGCWSGMRNLLPDEIRGWVAYQKRLLSEGGLDDARKHLLNEIGIREVRKKNPGVNVQTNDITWFIRLEEVKNYRSVYGTWPKQYGSDNANALFYWLYKNKRKMKNGLLPPDKAKALQNVLGMDIPEERPSE